MFYQHLETAHDNDGIGRIWLNRPEKRNALNRTLVEELREAALAMQSDEAIRVVVIGGRGSAFCAGADLDYLRRMAEFTLQDNMEDSQALATTLQTLYSLSKPTIARVHGPAIAGGAGLATVCDIVIAAEEATFGYTEVRIGFVPAIVMAFLLRKSTQMRVRELLLSGRIIGAEEAWEKGLVTKVVGGGEEGLDAYVSEVAGSIAKASPSGVRLTKEMLTALDGMSLDAGLDYASRMNALARMTPDCQEGIARFLKKQS
jgi:methylglutaconyl-CoA hydratase